MYRGFTLTAVIPARNTPNIATGYCRQLGIMIATRAPLARPFDCSQAPNRRELEGGQEMNPVLEIDDELFEETVLKADVPVLVDFSAAWCGPCKKLEPLVREIAQDYDGRLKVVKGDVDRAPQAAARFAVLSVPTVLLFQGGLVKDQQCGAVAKRVLSAMVDKVL